MRLLLLLGLAVALAGCAATGGTGRAAGTPAEQPGGDAVSSRADDLLVVIDRGDGSAPERYTLTCGDPVGGSHPDARAACGHLAGLDAPFAPLPDDVVCTEVYGGPQTASVTGVWHGEPVDLRLSRTDGCRISQWDSLGPLLPGPVGVDPPA